MDSDEQVRQLLKVHSELWKELKPIDEKAMTLRHQLQLVEQMILESCKPKITTVVQTACEEWMGTF